MRAARRLLCSLPSHYAGTQNEGARGDIMSFGDIALLVIGAIVVFLIGSFVYGQWDFARSEAQQEEVRAKTVRIIEAASADLRFYISSQWAGMAVDTKEQQFIIAHGGERLGPYPFSALVAVEIFTEQRTVIRTDRSGQIPAALVGGALFGGAGAVVGAMTKTNVKGDTTTSKHLRIVLSDLKNPSVVLRGLNDKDAEEWYARCLTMIRVSQA